MDGPNGRRIVISSLLAMGTFALAGAITPGPVNVLALAYGSTSTVGRPLAFVLGASLSYALVVLLIGLSAQYVLAGKAVWVSVAQWTGAIYLLWLAWKIASAPVSSIQATRDDSRILYWQAFGRGLSLQVLNPKAWLVALSGVGLFALPQENARVQLWLFCGISLVACMMGVGSWAALGSTLANWLDSPQRKRHFNRVLACALAITVVGMIFQPSH
jgi:threonine/homoserine/homoserine lactone efflux protein